MRIVIFANGDLKDPESELARWMTDDTRIVAADGGTAHVLAAGRVPDHVIGDVDSLAPPDVARLRAAGTIFHTHPPAKDETDLELALLWAAAQNAETIVVLGALGGRPDQQLANLLLLAMPALAGWDVSIADGAWTIRVIRGGETWSVPGGVGDTVSLVPMGGDVHGVTTHGMAYPLIDETLRFGPARGISNVVKAAPAQVTVGDGLLWCFHCLSAASV